MSDIWTLFLREFRLSSRTVHLGRGTACAKRINMTWLTRPLGEGLCYHVRVQCNNRSFRFETSEDFERYIALLWEVRKKHNFLLHHFTLMHTHVHLIITTPGPILLDTIMHAINQRYAADYHRRHQRCGHFWMNAYRCSVIDTDLYAWTCMRYLDRNALRAGLVRDPADWPWCGYNFYAHNDSHYPLDPHTSYLALAETAETRANWYRDFVTRLLASDEQREKEWITCAMNLYGDRARSKCKKR